MKKTVFVTGACGFIGSSLCNKLYADNFVIAIGSSDNQPKCHKYFHINLDGIPWNLISDNIDICFHQAANNNTTDLDHDRMLQSNLYSPIKIFSELYQRNCKQFVYASSSSVYGNQPAPYIENTTKTDPLNPYAVSKKLFEDYAIEFAQKFHVNTIGLRYTNVYGPGEGNKGRRASMIYQLLRKMMNYESPEVFKDGEQLRDWVYIDDVVDANILAANHSDSGIFNVGSGEAISFNKIVTLLNELLDMNFRTKYIDCPFKERYQTYTLADLNHSNKILSYFPKYSIRNGIEKLIEEIKKAR